MALPKIPPISVPPSQSFQGSDGSWSTFIIHVGNPPQTFNVLISTSGQETWVPSATGCNATNDSICGESRGALPFDRKPSRGFQVNASSTWTEMGTYGLDLGRQLDYTGRGLYALDSVGLGLPITAGIPNVKVDRQVVAAINSSDFSFGQLGLGPKPTNFSDFSNPQPSFMGTLRTQGLIPSISFGYTAGAPYRLKKTLGSLTLGGYDSSLFEPNGIKFVFGPNDSKSLTVGVQSIIANNTLKNNSTNPNISLLPTEILALIDSSVPDIWLPREACSRFEDAFGLRFDGRTNRYLVNETMHAELTRRNPAITFSLTNSLAGKGVQIVLPYQAFDLLASFPVYPNLTRFFPLRRAANDTQYTLGRALLQEAYIVADYERSQFWVSQTVFKEDNPSKLVAINPPEAVNAKYPLDTTMIAIIVGTLVGVVLFFSTMLWAFRARRKRKMREMGSPQDKSSDHEISRPATPNRMMIGGPVELTGGSMRHELVGGGWRHELSSRNIVAEMPARPYR